MKHYDESESEFQRSLTPEIWRQINPNYDLLDFEIIKKAVSGDETAIHKVMEHYQEDLAIYTQDIDGEDNAEFAEMFLRCFRKSILQYRIRPGDTYWSFEELLDRTFNQIDKELNDE